MSETAEIVDAEIVRDDLEPVQAPVSTELARRERRSEVIRPLDPDQLVESFQAYQDLLPRLLDNSDYQPAGKDKDGKPKRFVKKSGWRKIATAFDLDVVRVHEEVERDDQGQPIRAKAIYRAIAPSGRMMDGDGYCSIDEDRFSGPRGNKTKLENDLRATATTRAKNRAISDLVGMGDVSAEEVDGSPNGHEIAEASAELKGVVRTVISYLVDGNESATREALAALSKQFDAHTPAIAGQAIAIIGSAVKRYREQGVPDKPSDLERPPEGE